MHCCMRHLGMIDDFYHGRRPSRVRNTTRAYANARQHFASTAENHAISGGPGYVPLQLNDATPLCDTVKQVAHAPLKQHRSRPGTQEARPASQIPPRGVRVGLVQESDPVAAPAAIALEYADAP